MSLRGFVGLWLIFLQYGGEPVRVTASFGVAALDPQTRDMEGLLQHADLALYEAKSAGRNRCVLWKGAEANNVIQRRRVLKGGQIRFNGHESSIDCTVRSLSEDVAGIDVYTSVGIPKDLTFASGRTASRSTVA